MGEVVIRYVTLPVVETFTGNTHVLYPDGTVLRNSGVDLEILYSGLNSKRIEDHAVRYSEWGRWATIWASGKNSQCRGQENIEADPWKKWASRSSSSQRTRYTPEASSTKATGPHTWDDTVRYMTGLLYARKHKAKDGGWQRWSLTCSGNQNKRIRRATYGEQE
jgi:hypothetical protein